MKDRTNRRKPLKVLLAYGVIVVVGAIGLVGAFATDVALGISLVVSLAVCWSVIVIAEHDF